MPRSGGGGKHLGGAPVPELGSGDAGKALIWNGSAWEKQTPSGGTAGLAPRAGSQAITVLASVTTITAPVPAGARAGDRLFAHFMHRGGLTSETVPAPWKLLGAWDHLEGTTTQYVRLYTCENPAAGVAMPTLNFSTATARAVAQSVALPATDEPELTSLATVANASYTALTPSFHAIGPGVALWFIDSITAQSTGDTVFTSDNANDVAVLGQGPQHRVALFRSPSVDGGAFAQRTFSYTGALAGAGLGVVGVLVQPKGTKIPAATGGGSSSGWTVEELFGGDFSAYTALSLTAADWEVTGGVARPAAGSAGGDRIVQRTGVTLTDSLQVMKFRHISNATAGESVGLFARVLDVNNLVLAMAHESGAFIFTRDAGTWTQQGAMAGVTAGTNVWRWLRFAVSGDMARLEWHDVHPDLGTNRGVPTVEVTLPAKFAAGVAGGVGLRLNAASQSRELADHRVRDLSL